MQRYQFKTRKDINKKFNVLNNRNMRPSAWEARVAAKEYALFRTDGHYSRRIITKLVQYNASILNIK